MTNRILAAKIVTFLCSYTLLHVSFGLKICQTPLRRLFLTNAVRLSCGVGAAAALLLGRDVWADAALLVATPTYFVNSPAI